MACWELLRCGRQKMSISGYSSLVASLWTLTMFFSVDLLLFVSPVFHVLYNVHSGDNPLQLPLTIPFILHLLYLYLYSYLIYVCFCYPALKCGPQSVDAVWVNLAQFSLAAAPQSSSQHFTPIHLLPTTPWSSQQTHPQRPRNTQNCQSPLTSKGTTS